MAETARVRATEALVAQVEERRVRASSSVSSSQRARLGQFFTPSPAGELIASLARLPEAGTVRILDPGAGVGSLAVALLARILRERPGLKVEITALELDTALLPYLEETIDDISRASATTAAQVTTTLMHGDFVDSSTELRQERLGLERHFDFVIMNPPYGKLGATSPYRRALQRRGVECPNLYAAFLALGIEHLLPGGQLLAITPRSFANGPYFADFRQFFLARTALDHIHSFESRSTVFADTDVLQETIVIAATADGKTDNVRLSSSRGHVDQPTQRSAAYRDVVHPGDTQAFIRIPGSRDDTALAELMAQQPASLGQLDLKVSTGRVVDFRCRDRLLDRPLSHSAPLIYPTNVRSGVIQWPRDIKKAQAFALTDMGDHEKFVMPSGYYVVVRRFSAKEERRRVVAAVWEPRIHEGPVAFENHLNVIHSAGHGLDRDLAVGLSYWLNCTLVDHYFRTFSGHTQVNATDLRSLRFPLRENLQALGAQLQPQLPSQEAIDELVRSMLDDISAAAAA